MRAGKWCVAFLLGCVSVLGCGVAQFHYVEQVGASAARNEQKAAPVEVLSVHDEYRLELDGTFVHTFRQRYRILEQAGVTGWGATEAHWSPWYMDRPEITATVTSPSGEQAALDPTTIADSAAYPEAPDVYGDSRVLRAPLPNVGVGSVVEEVIVRRARQPFLGQAYTHQVMLQGPVRRGEVEVVVDVPEGAPLQYELLDAKVDPSESTENGRRRLTFRGGSYAGLEPIEPFAPSDVPAWPSLAFTLGEAWQPLAARYRAIVDEKIGALGLDDVVATVVAPGDERDAMVAKLFAWVKKRVRYVGIEFGESSVLPRAPSETLTRGYGDCKDQATLLVGLLRAAGIDAKVALLRAGTQEDVRVKLPGLNVFNHAIVVVPGDPPSWIDPTMDYGRPGELPIADWNRLALVIDDATAGLTRTPTPAAADNTYHEVRTLELAELGRARAHEVSGGTGLVDRDLRGRSVGPRDDLTKAYERYAQQEYNAKSVAGVEVSNAEDLTRPFETRIDAEGARIAITSLLGADAIVGGDAVFSWLPYELRDGEGERRTDLIVPVPFRAEVSWVVKPPTGFVAKDVPPARREAIGPGDYERSAQVRADGAVELRYALTLSGARMKPAEVVAFREAVKKLRAEPTPRVTFVHEAKAHFDAGRQREGLASLRKQVEAQPKSGAALMRLAASLAELGLGTSARQLAAQAVALEPDSAILAFHHGDIASRDLFARAFHEGFDRDAALAAYRRAVELDPDDTASKLEIGVLLEHGPTGERYGRGSDLEAAVAAYDAIGPEAVRKHDPTYLPNPLYALLWAQRFDELDKRLAALPAGERPPVLVIVSAAARGGANEGLAAVRGLGLAADARAAIIGSAADTLVRLRRYPEAAALSELAADASGDARVRLQAALRGRLTRVDPTRLPADSAAHAVVRGYVQLLSLPNAQARDYVVARSYGSDGVSAAADLLDGAVTTARRSGNSNEVLADSAALMEVTEEGSDDEGYRVVIRSDLATATQLAFVVREAGAYRIVAFESAPSELGCEALSLAKSGKPRAAKRWLDWAHELVGSSPGQDPLRLQPFLELWVDGKGDLELASAALCAQGHLAERAVPVLEAARAKAAPALALTIDHALVLAYDDRHRQDTLGAAERLEKAFPTSFTARAFVVGALVALERHDDARQRVTGYLAGAPDDTAALAMLAHVEEAAGRRVEARQAADKLIATGHATPSTLNGQAWRGLVLGNVRDEDLRYALLAVQRAPADDAALHTLGCLYADLGRIDEARQTLMKLLAMRPGGNPASLDWYIVGRVAEHLALPDEARAAYARIDKPKRVTPSMVYALAAKRVAGIK
ncbi:MAG: DUF3857 domain-containing protein [Polyangiaceae bacterium]|nr:DUF3857 domain-containing protein [Polyangiaceae bacterium]